MKKLLSGITALGACLMLTAAPLTLGAMAEAEPNPLASQIKDVNNWTCTRASVEATDAGVKISQLEMGTPDNHAIAIFEVPFTDVENFEITFRITMEDYVASGRNANDVWTAVNVMGVPEFFNWRNCTETEKSPTTGYGWAKDTPGLVTRYFSYDGDLRMISDIYQGGYKTAGDDPTSEEVDTWTLLNTSAGTTITKDVTMRLTYGDQGFYSMFINNEKVTTTDQFAFIEKDKLFADGKLYLTVVMNTQNKESNSLSNIVIKSVNGVSLANEKSDDKKTEKKGGCGSVIGGAFVGVSTVVMLGVMLKRKEN